MRAQRSILVLAGLSLLLLAGLRTRPLAGGQAAVSWSLPGHEDLSFWVDHDGLVELDVEGQVGFGDMARLLMRRRANAPLMRALRDRFRFRSDDFTTLKTPDLFRAELGPSGPVWLHAPERFVVAAGRIFNLPLTIVNRTGRRMAVRARIGSSSFSSKIAPNAAAGYFLKVVEPAPGIHERRLVLTVGNRELTAAVAFDVRPLARLRVKLLDQDGSPAAARVYLTAADGLGYAPPGSISRFAALPAEQYFHADREFEIDLPTGDTLIEATRGPEYRLVSRRLELRPGETTEITLRLRRWIHLAARGWYSADSHIHANYTAPHHQVITPADVRLQTLAEDLNNANMMVANSGSDFLHDEALFEGKPHRLSLPDYIVYWNEEMRNAGLYGHMCFFGLKFLVRPVYTGFRDTPNWEDYPPNYAQAKAAREQGGAVTYAHPGYGATFVRASARELPVDLALGEVDAMDVLSNNPEEVAMELWYRLLNCGFRLAISAGSDAFTNVTDHYTPGGGRVWVHLPGPMRYWDWIRNYKRGRSFASNGPAIFFALEGREPGEELRFDRGPQTLRVIAEVRTQVPLDTIEVVVNGRPVISRAVQGAGVFTIDRKITLARSSWVAVRALGPWHRLILNDTGAFAHTSPVYVTIGGQPVCVAEDLRFYIDWIDQLIDRVRRRGRFATPERAEEVVALFQRARQIYQDALPNR